MIVYEHDEGWGKHLGLKKRQQQMLRQFVDCWVQDQSRTVILDDTWYDTSAHAAVCSQIASVDPDRVLVVSMHDQSNVQLEAFQTLGCDIIGIGYRPGPGQLDFWAMATQENFIWDGVDIDTLDCIDTPYMCLNRKPHHHRMLLINALQARGIIDQGLVSLGGDPAIRRVLPNDQGISDLAPNPGIQGLGIANDIMTLGSAQNWQRHFLNIVTETTWDINHSQFVSEKIFKPMIGQRPFLVWDPTGAVDWLVARGFEPYHRDFSDITGLDLAQHENIPRFLQTLCAQPPQYFRAKMVALRSKILHNKQRFGQYAQEQRNLISQGIQCLI